MRTACIGNNQVTTLNSQKDEPKETWGRFALDVIESAGEILCLFIDDPNVAHLEENDLRRLGIQQKLWKFLTGHRD